MKKNKKNLTKMPDDRFLNNRNSAVSPEFVPNPINDGYISSSQDSDEPFDIIPELKGKHF